MKLVAKFVTAMRAASLLEDLAAAGIKGYAVRPKWTNKRLPPPNIEVTVDDADLDKANVITRRFQGGGVQVKHPSGRAVKVPSHIDTETYLSKGGNTVLEYFGGTNGLLIIPEGGSITITFPDEGDDAIVTWQEADDREAEDRCKVCGWPLASNVKEGCIPGNCCWYRRTQTVRQKLEAREKG